MTNKRTVSEDIKHFNLSYLLLVQRLVCESQSEATDISGLSHDMVVAIQSLTLPQLASLAETNQFLVKPGTSIVKALASTTSSMHISERKIFTNF